MTKDTFHILYVRNANAASLFFGMILNEPLE